MGSLLHVSLSTGQSFVANHPSQETEVLGSEKLLTMPQTKIGYRTTLHEIAENKQQQKQWQ